MADQSGSNAGAGRVQGEALSSLLDGELDAAGVERACRDWRADSGPRDTWHAYSLIGDVMRCEDLASSPVRDEQFLRDFRARMSVEAVVLAPRPVLQANADSLGGVALPRARFGRGRGWAVPVSVAAGFLVVMGAMLLTRVPSPTSIDAAQMAAAPADSSSSPMVTVSQVESAAPPFEAYPAEMELVFDGQVIRDPRLDRYLLAHKQFAGSSVLGPTSGLLRNAAVEVPAR